MDSSLVMPVTVAPDVVVALATKNSSSAFVLLLIVALTSRVTDLPAGITKVLSPVKLKSAVSLAPAVVASHSLSDSSSSVSTVPSATSAPVELPSFTVPSFLRSSKLCSSSGWLVTESTKNLNLLICTSSPEFSAL